MKRLEGLILLMILEERLMRGMRLLIYLSKLLAGLFVLAFRSCFPEERGKKEEKVRNLKI